MTFGIGISLGHSQRLRLYLGTEGHYLWALWTRAPGCFNLPPLISVSQLSFAALVFCFRAVPSKWKEASLANAVCRSLRMLRFIGRTSDIPTPSHGKETAKNALGTWNGAIRSKTVLLSSTRKETEVLTTSSPNSNEQQQPSGMWTLPIPASKISFSPLPSWQSRKTDKFLLTL